MERNPGPDEWERPSAPARHERHVLRLYVSGLTPRSSRAVAAIRELCEEYLAGRYELVVIDLYQQPALAGREQVVAAPTLVKQQPLPVRRLIGDLADEGRVRCWLGLP